MSANVETMFYAGREKPWHGLGVQVEDALCSDEALKMAGLDWEVNQEPIMIESGDVIAGYKANVRDSDNTILGIVTDRYKVVQNTQAFDFTNGLIGGDVRYETAGSLQGGKRIWLLAKMPTKSILGDDVEPYLCFTNTHDGSGAIRICMTPIRVVCNNTLNIALDTAQRQWSTRHMGDLETKMEEARNCLAMANSYMIALDESSDRLANTKISDEAIMAAFDELFPVDEKSTDRKKENVKQIKDEYMVCYFSPDISQFKGTVWGAVNAMSDLVCHNAPKRTTATYQENNWGRIMDGHPIMDRFCELVGAK